MTRVRYLRSPKGIAVVLCIWNALPAEAQSSGVAVDQSCQRETTTRSQGAVGETEYTVKNQTAERLIVYWLDYQGRRQRWFELQPGATHVQRTYRTHPWLVADSRGQCSRIFNAPGNIVVAASSGVMGERRALAQSSSRSLVLMVDGADYLGTGENRVGKTGYLANAMWSASDALRQLNPEIKPYAWSGDVLQTRAAVEDLKRNIAQSLQVARNDRRPLAIVGHSWGGVLSYIALRELDEAGQLRDGDLALFLTIHTPINMKPVHPLILPSERSVSVFIFGVVRSHVRTPLLPVRAGSWKNYWSTEDWLSGEIPVATSMENRGVGHTGSYTEAALVARYAADLSAGLQATGTRVEAGSQEAEPSRSDQAQGIQVGSRVSWKPMSGMSRCQIERIAGHVDPVVDLRDDVVAKELLSSGKDGVLAKCRPKLPFSVVVELHTSKYKEGKEAATTGAFEIERGSWILTAYTNRILPRAEDATSTPRFAMEQCQWTTSYRSVVAVVDRGVDLSDDGAARQVLEKAAVFAREKCPSKQQANIAVRVLQPGWPKEAVVVARQYAYGETLRWTEYYNEALLQKQAGEQQRREEEQARAAAEVRRREAAAAEERRKRAQALMEEFERKYRVRHWQARTDFQVNPFRFEGQVVALVAGLTKMVSPTEAEFLIFSETMVVSGIPRGQLATTADTHILALIPKEAPRGSARRYELQFVGGLACQAYGCADLLTEDFLRTRIK